MRQQVAFSPSFSQPIDASLSSGWMRGGSDQKHHSVLKQSASSSSNAVATVSEENLQILSSRGRQALEKLMEFDQAEGKLAQQHVYMDWPEPGTNDGDKKRLAEQV